METEGFSDIPSPHPTSSPSLIDDLKSNKFFSAGFGLGILGAASALLRKFSTLGISGIRRRLLVSVELNSRDPSYTWFLTWMAENVRHTQHLSVSTNFTRHDNGSVTTSFGFLPSTGRHFFRYRGSYMMCERVRETATLAKSGRTIVYTAMGHEWRQFGNPLRQRPISSIYLGHDTRDKILSDIQEFLESQEWYIGHGVPYRRGYLFYGEPGSGKTSFIHALAGAIGYNICVVNLSEKTWTDDRLQYLFANCPNRSILLLEDVDAAFIDRQAEIPRGYTRADAHLLLSYSGLLNALDGITSSDAQLVFMTTNHRQLLDPALIRPGRVDVQQYFGHAQTQQIISIFQHFFPNATLEQCNQFLGDIPEGRVSMATLQGLFLVHKDNVEGLLGEAAQLKHTIEHGSELSKEKELESG